MKTDNSEYIQPALSVIAHYDPDTFSQIDRADWYVSVVDNPEDLTPLLPRIGIAEMISLAESLSNANGVTILPQQGAAPVPPWAARRPTWINRSNLREDAGHGGFNEVHYLAYTLVHEFAHHQGESTEPPAYDAGRAFALKMGDASIARSADQVKARVLRNQERIEELPPFLRPYFDYL